MYNGQFLIDKYLHKTFFQNKRGGFFVECGAVDGELETTCKFFECNLEWTGINIEPVPNLFKLLEHNRPNCTNLNVALSDKQCVATFAHAVHPRHGSIFGNGSLRHDEAHMEDLVKQGCRFEKYEVQCDKFSNVFKPAREIDLFVLDVEGHELSALNGIMDLDVKYLPKIFCIEHSFAGIKNISNMLKTTHKLYSVQKHNAIYTKTD
jgi:FkbM family methyltransferase